MEFQLNELIQKVKNDAIKSGNEAADNIIADAKAEAARIVNEAKAQAEQIISSARNDAEQSAQSGIQSIRQAGRDTILLLQKQIISIFDEILKDAITTEYGNVLEEVITRVVDKWNPDDAGEPLIEMNEQDYNRLKSFLTERLKTKGGKTLKVEITDEVQIGFRLFDSDVRYGFTADDITDALAALLNPRLGSLIMDAKDKG